MRQTCSNTVGPSPVRCSTNWIERRLALPSSFLSRRLRSISGFSRRSTPSFDQVKGEQHRLMAPASAPQRMKVRCAVVAGDHGLAVDQGRLRLEAERGVNDCREAVGPVMAVAGEAPDARAIPAHHQPIAVVLDFVNQSGPVGGRATFDGRHGWMKPEGWTMRACGKEEAVIVRSVLAKAG